MTVPARLNIVTLGVHDLARSSAFYERLGWERAASSSEEICWFRTAGAFLGLWDFGLLARDANLPDGPVGSYRGVTFAINVETEDAVAAALQEAATAGGAILKPATRADWGGVSGYFTDPDGYAWEVAYNPFFPLDEDGRVSIP
jgi:hypothetical protein